MKAEVPDRTGQVWEWTRGQLALVLASSRQDLHCDPKIDERVHKVLMLELGMVDGLYETPSEPWESKPKFRRIA